MKSNKLRLAALAMTLAMVTTSVPSSVLAADFTSDFEFTSDSEGATVDFADPFADFVDQTEEAYTGEVAAEETAITLAEEDVHFFFMEEGHEDYTVQYTPKKGGVAIEGSPFILMDGEKVAHADVVNEKPATCEAGPSFQMSAKIENYGTYTSDLFYLGGSKEAQKLGHDWAELETRNTATCEQAGEIFEDQRCKREHLDENGNPITVWRSEYATIADDDDYEPAKQAVPARGHNVKEWVVTYPEEDFDNAKLMPGSDVPVQDEAHKAWSYKEVKTGTCIVCGKEITEEKVHAFEADPTSPGFSLDNFDNVVPIEYDDYEEDLKNKDYSRIALEDCFKPGTFDIVLTSSEGKSSVYETVTIEPPHHVADTIEIYAEDGKTPIYNFSANPDEDIEPKEFPDYALAISRKDGVLSINSTYCAESGKTVTYYKKVLCVNAYTEGDHKGEPHVISNTKEVANPAGKHSYDTVTAALIKPLIGTSPLLYGTVAGLIPDSDPTKGPDKEAGDNLIVDIRLGTASCTTAGTIFVDYRCADCNKVVKTDTLTITKAIGHVPQEKPVVENYVAPTCTENGTYNEVTYCKICNGVAKKTPVVIDKLGHAWERKGYKEEPKTFFLEAEGNVIVDEFDKGNKGCLEQMFEDDPKQDVGTRLSEYAYKWVDVLLKEECPFCGKKRDVEAGEVSVVIDGFEDVGNYCQEKEITFTATYKLDGKEIDKQTYSVPYYSDIIDYVSRTNHEPGEPIIENEVPATETEPGSVDVVVYCKRCGHEIKRSSQTIDPDVEPHDLKHVEAVEATCEKDGNIEYWVCEEEDKYYLDEKGETPIEKDFTVVPAGHDLKLVEAKEPTTTEEGNIEYFVCERCGKLFVQVEDPETGLGLVETTEEEVKLPKKKELPAKVEGVKTNMYPSDVYPTKGYAKISWKAVENADNYRVSVRELGTTTWTKIETNSTATSYTVKEPLITVGKSYEVRVAAGKDGVFGPRSTVIRRYYESVKPSFAKTSNSITVSWSPVPKGSSYMVIYSENKSMKPYKTIIVRNGITEATLKSLKAGTRYYIRVRPYDKTGKTATGALSPLKSVVTKK
jgi:hypothetical protein